MSSKLYIDYDARHEGGECENDEPWSSRTPEHITLSVNGLYIEPREVFGEDVATIFVPHQGMVVHLVIVRYQSGDTFGHRTGNFKFVACYETYEEALALAKEIENNSNSREPKFSFKPNTPYTESEIYCGSWVGYFERLEYIDVESFTVI